jgi:hypothetical protein
VNAYSQFLRSKRLVVDPAGIEEPPPVSERLFPFQRDITTWALRRGRAAIWADCGLGKGWMALEWARIVAAEQDEPVLILAPLAVAQQFRREGEKLGVHVTVCRSSDDVMPGVNVTNYDRLHRFDPGAFGGVVLDESSCLKDYTSATRNELIAAFSRTPFRLACSATPAPNDHMELGNHAEFLGAMTRAEMLATFFCHDGGETQVWRLKGHARADFWRWLCSWAVNIRKPSDLGYTDEGYDLPPLNVHEHIVPVGPEYAKEAGTLFIDAASGLEAQRASRRSSLGARVAKCADIVRASWTEQRRRDYRANGELPIRTGSTESDESATPEMQSGEHIRRPKRRSAQRDHGETATSSGCSASPSPSTIGVSTSRAADAPSAEAERLTLLEDGSQSTTAMAPARFAGSSAMHVTGGSPNLETIRSVSSVPLPISGAWLIWVDLNAEQDGVARLLGDCAFSVQGSDDPEDKEERIVAWCAGERPVMISKPSVMGFGLNLQHCSHVAFVGLSNSFEAWYQAIRRTWRFGQLRPVDCHLILSDADGSVRATLERKRLAAEEMADEMLGGMAEIQKATVRALERDTDTYEPKVRMRVPEWLTTEAA